MAVQIRIGLRDFPSKKAAKDFFRNMRDAYKDGVPIKVEDDAILRDLVSCHPDAIQKYGTGIDYFTVATEYRPGRTRHFVIHRMDGTKTDFSFAKPIDGPNKRRDCLAALRAAISDQIMDFKNEAFGASPQVRCAQTDELLTKNEAHVDHQPPHEFLKLVMAWMAHENIDFDDIALVPQVDDRIGSRLQDEAQECRWRLFHQRHAHLRILSKKANLSAPKPRLHSPKG